MIKEGILWRERRIQKIACSLLAGVLCLSCLMPWTAYGTDEATAGESQYTESSTFEADDPSEQDLDSGASAHSGSGQAQSNQNIGKTADDEVERITVTTAEELLAIAQRVNDGDSMENAVITLANDISLKAYDAWTPIGADVDNPFCGVFDGNNFTISNITVAQEVYGGLFGFVSGATIKNLQLYQVAASHSTRGMFFAASSTQFEDCFYKSGPLGLFKAKVMFTLFSVPWSGAQDTSWYNTTDTVYLISTPEQFAGLSKLVADGTSTFSDKTVVLTASINMGDDDSWVPVGVWATEPFSGTFQAMEGAVISHLSSEKGGLFDYTDGAVIKNVTLEDSYISTSTAGYKTGIGAIVNYSKGSSIQGCTVSRTTLINTLSSNAYTGGIAGEFHSGQAMINGVWQDVPSYIMQCLVENSEIKSTGTTAQGIGGIVGQSTAFAIVQNVLYGTTVYSASTVSTAGASGIVYKQAGGNTGSSISQNLLLNSGITGIGDKDGIVCRFGSNRDAASNNFISDIGMPSNTYLGTSVTENSMTSFFTDMPGTLPLINTSGLYVLNHCWDKTVAPVRARVEGKAEGYSTDYLTNGVFNINEAFWTAEKNYYPRLSALTGSSNPRIAAIASLASVPILQVNPAEPLGDSKGILLLDETAEGHAIEWRSITIDGLLVKSPARDQSDTAYATMVYNVATFQISVNDLIAVVTVDGQEYIKHYPSITIKDSVLREDETLRTPDIGSTASDPAIEALDIKPQLTFIDPVMLSLYAGQAYLEVLRSNNLWQTVASVDCSAVSQNFAISTTVPYTVTLDFTDYSDPISPINPIQPGNRYRVILPADMVKEQGKANYSPAIEMYFQTADFGMPSISLNNRPDPYVAGDIVPLSDAVSWFRVHNRGLTITPQLSDMQPVPGAWITGPLASSTENILTQMQSGTLPVGNNVTLYYAVDGASINSVVPDAGNYDFYVFIVNAEGNTAFRRIRFTVEGQRGWAQQPATHRHLVWTDDKELIKSVALMGARGSYASASGTQMRAHLKAEIDDAQWALNATNDGEAFKIDVNTYVLQQDGVTPATAPVTVTVYLDRNIQFRAGTTWLSMRAPSSIAAVESLIYSTITRNDGYTVTLEHTQELDSGSWYQAAGEYTVKMHLAPEGVISYCNDQSHVDTAEKILEYSVNLIPPQKGNSNIQFWNEVVEEIENAKGYLPVSRKMVPEVMPYDVMGTLQEHIYNDLHLDMGDYRWNFYGHAIKDAPGWRYDYPLKIEFVSENAVSKLTQGYSEKQFRFAGEGRLFADAELDILLSSAQDETWTLYKYHEGEARLSFVSNVIMDGKWAQTNIDTMDKTVYVLSTLPYDASNRTLFAATSASPYDAVSFSAASAATGALEAGQTHLETGMEDTITAQQQADMNKKLLTASALIGMLAAGLVVCKKYGQKRRAQDVADKSSL